MLDWLSFLLGGILIGLVITLVVAYKYKED